MTQNEQKSGSSSYAENTGETHEQRFDPTLGFEWPKLAEQSTPGPLFWVAVGAIGVMALGWWFRD